MGEDGAATGPEMGWIWVVEQLFLEMGAETCTARSQ